MGLKKFKENPCDVQFPVKLKKFREPKRNQRPREVPSVKRRPQSLNPKDPKEELKAYWEGL